MTEAEKKTIARLHSQGLLITRVAGKWRDLSSGQAKETIVIYDDKYYKVSQKRKWWSNQLTLDCGWEYLPVGVVEVRFATKTKKVVTKMWKEIA